MELLKNFRKAATQAEREQLADALGTSISYLFDHLGKHRRISVDQAAVIEDVTTEIAANNGGTTPVIQRENLCAACVKCPLACSARAAQEFA